MAALSDYVENQLVQHFLRATAAPSPATVYLALFESDPLDAGSGTETAYTNYERKASTWSTFAAGQTKNAGIITFPANGHGSTSYTITHAAVFDALTTGNMLIHGALAAQKILAPGDVLSFAVNALVLSLD